MTDLWERPLEIMVSGQGSPRYIRNRRGAIASLGWRFLERLQRRRQAPKYRVNAIDHLANTKKAGRAFSRAAKRAGLLPG